MTLATLRKKYAKLKKAQKKKMVMPISAQPSVYISDDDETEKRLLVRILDYEPWSMVRRF